MNKEKIVGRAGYIALSVLVAAAGSLPFFLFADFIKNVSAAGYIGLFAATVLTNASVLLPASGIAFTVSASTVLDPLLCVLTGGMGTALGELVSYYCGRSGSAAVEDVKLFSKINNYLKKYGVLVVFFFALLPLPVFDLVGIAAGSSKMSVIKYITACFIGKTLKLAAYVFLLKNYLHI